MNQHFTGRSSERVVDVAAPSRRRQSPSRWLDLMARIGTEIAAPLTAAIERIDVLTHTGQIDRAGLRALHDEVEAARRAGIVGQQLARFDERRVRLSSECLGLLDVLNGAVALRSHEARTRGLALVVEPTAMPADVLVDAPLLHTLVNTIVDWALIDAETQISFSVQTRSWPPGARLVCQYARRHRESASDEAARNDDEPLVWRLLETVADLLEVELERRIEPASTTLELAFRGATGLPEADDRATELDEGFASSSNSQPLAGSHVLVIASRRDLRTEIRDALRRMSLIVDFVSSVDEASDFCRDGLPHGVLVESIQVGERFAAFRADVVRDVPGFAFIEILEEGKAFEASSGDGATLARIGRNALASSLPSALLFELALAGAPGAGPPSPRS